MRGVDVAAGAVAIGLLASLGVAPQASAQGFGVGLNGTYRVLSDGEWAKRGMAPGGGDVFFDQQTVVETWNVTTNCTSPIECTGTVTSDRGYTASIRLDDYWYVEHEVPNWIPCPDGTSVSGRQMFILWGFNPARNERVKSTEFLAGRNVTKSPSGACGRNQPLVIELPVRMQRA